MAAGSALDMVVPEMRIFMKSMCTACAVCLACVVRWASAVWRSHTWVQHARVSSCVVGEVRLCQLVCW
jgi:hypothetical protein